MTTTSASGRRREALTLAGLRGQLVSVQQAALTRSVALLGMRVIAAWIFIYHGAGKLFNFKHQGGITGTTFFFHAQGIPAPHLMAYVVGLTEFGGGLLLLVGLAVPVVGIALAIDMLVAMASTTFSGGMVPHAIPHVTTFVADGFQINLALMALSLAVAALGAGLFSLDAGLGLSPGRARAR